MHGSAELSRQGHDALMDRFRREVDPELVLPEAERQSRAEALRRAHMTRLALRSAESRAARKGNRGRA